VAHTGPAGGAPLEEPNLTSEYKAVVIMTSLFTPIHRSDSGFTLLEVMIVLFILGLITAMAWSGAGVMDDARRRQITLEKMDRIRAAVMGPDGVYDPKGRRIIGGYVGDMKHFPGLWEARAQVRNDYAGLSWPNPDQGLGQGPSYDMDPAKVFFRPSGTFTAGKWQWHRPYRRLTDDPENNDHIGGLETENEGQPRGLWTRFTEDLPYDLLGHPAPGEVEGENWKGPYLVPPVEKHPKTADHYAQTDDQYLALEPRWHTGLSREAWEDGDYAASLGEHYDDKENFRLLNNEGRLTDGWHRSLRFFITQDPDRPGSTIFWIISEGPDHDGFYPSKGTCTGRVWTEDADDTMGKNYAPDHPANRDNIVMKIYSHDFETVFEEETRGKTQMTQNILNQIRRAVIGEAPAGRNSGYTGDLGSLPDLFQWHPENGHWDKADNDGTPYTKGQPRGLWTSSPNSVDSGDDLAFSLWGIGWRTRYLPTPDGYGESQKLTDAWDNTLLFFHDTTDDALMVLSPGPDQDYDFGEDPDDPVEDLDLGDYDPSLPENLDNLYLQIRSRDFYPGYLDLHTLTVLNATAGVTKARLFRGEGDIASQTRTADTLIDVNGDGIADDWSVGSMGSPVFKYDDTTPDPIFTGARYLVFWNDTDGNSEIDIGELFRTVVLNITAEPGSTVISGITVNTDDFTPAS
jgi:prepilin-type N-terminal cleavage/methylation domain-containing protein